MEKKEYPYQNISLENIKGERWKDIPNFQGEYQISNFGRVKSLGRRIDCGKYDRFRPERIKRLKKSKDPKKGLYTQLHRDGNRHSFPVARLVYHVFVAPFDMEDRTVVVTRKDGDILNCYHKNLVLRAASDVMRDAFTAKAVRSQFQLKDKPSGRQSTNENKSAVLMGGNQTSTPTNSDAHFLNRDIRNIRNEKWKPIKGYEGLYEISDHGRVKSPRRLKKIITSKGNGTNIWTKEYIVTQIPTTRFNHFINEPIYSISVTLKKEGNTKGFAVCRLVYQAFGKKEKGLATKVIMHKDGDNLNNHISNLHAATRTEIHKASYANDRRISHFADLTPKQKREYSLRRANAIKKPVIQYSLQNKRIATFDSLVAAAKATGVRSSGISNALNRKFKAAGGFIWRRGKK